jgi:hypothetical protein
MDRFYGASKHSTQAAADKQIIRQGRGEAASLRDKVSATDNPCIVRVLIDPQRRKPEVERPKPEAQQHAYTHLTAHSDSSSR